MKKTIGKIALLLIISMLVGLVAGCDNATPAATPAATTVPGSTTATTATAATTASNINPPGQLPVVKEKVTIRLVMAQNPNILSYKYGENKLTTFLQDRTNVAIDFVLFPSAEAGTKLNLELSTGGDLGDVCMIQMDKAQLSSYGGQGVLTPLNKYIDKYGFYLDQAFEVFPNDMPKITAPDGNIYAYPNVSVTCLFPNTLGMRFWIHQGFLDKYGKGMPKTTEEMYQFMKWAKTSDPNGNGKADEMGWTGSETQWYAKPTQFLMNAFTLQDANGYYQKDDKIHFAKIENGWRNGLKYLAKLMKEGLLDENYLTNNATTLNTVIGQNNGDTVATLAMGGLHMASPLNSVKLKYQEVLPLKGPDGFQNAFFAYYERGMDPGMYTIPMKSTQKDVVAAWIDSNYAQEVYMSGRFGEKGVDWDIPTAGTKAVDDGPAMFADYRQQWNVNTYSHWHSGNPSPWKHYLGGAGLPVPSPDKDGKPTYDLERDLYVYTRAMEKFVTPCSVPPFFFDKDTSIQVSELNATIGKLANTAQAEFIFGKLDINSDADWFNYVAMIKAAGIDEYLKIQQAEYDRAWKGTLPKTYVPEPQRTK